MDPVLKPHTKLPSSNNVIVLHPIPTFIISAITLFSFKLHMHIFCSSSDKDTTISLKFLFVARPVIGAFACPPRKICTTADSLTETIETTISSPATATKASPCSCSLLFASTQDKQYNGPPFVFAFRFSVFLN